VAALKTVVGDGEILHSGGGGQQSAAAGDDCCVLRGKEGERERCAPFGVCAYVCVCAL
jgi:hypothetical protein